MQEDVEVLDNQIRLKEDIQEGQHIRREGADFKPGHVLAAEGSVVRPGLTAVLAFLGKSQPLVYASPLVTLITTGDELVDIDEVPLQGQIRDTNSTMLSSQIRDSIGTTPTLLRVRDRKELLERALSEASKLSDVIIVSGGASVGDKDYLAETVQGLGKVHFHRVAIRPGKPVLFGKIGECLIFGLPGNPASAFVCFELFVRESLRRLSGWADPELRWVPMTIGFDHPAVGREDFVRVTTADGVVTPVGTQGSFGIASVATCSGLARFPADRDVRSGETCEIYFFG
jgi:molybdopterin molybdotransferase